MIKILVTGFEPFNKSTINPSMLIVEQLEAPDGVTLIKEILPVEFKATTLRLKGLLAEHKPDIVVSIGQAGNRPEICIERVAINLDNVRSSNGKTTLPDNAGFAPVDQPIEIDGAPAFFSTLPIWNLVSGIQAKDIPATVSYSAGTYVCNHVMYTVLHEASLIYPDMKAGFIHVPFLPEQLAVSSPKTDTSSNLPAPPGYSMPLEDMITAVQTALNLLAGQ